jgi:hypothetical protein
MTRHLLLVILALGGGTGPVGLAADISIVDFASEADLRGLEWDPANVELSVGPRAVTERDPVLKLVAKGGSYPSVNLRAPRVPRDWSGFEALSFTVWSNSERELAVRVDDAKSVGYSSRFNGGAPLAKGRTRVQIPLAAIAKAIDLRNVTVLSLFLDHPPAGFTLWIDDIRLGRIVPDQVPFIPYAERADHQPTMEVVSPHLPFGRRLAGGPLSAFLIGGVKQGREVVELMQRLDLLPKVLSWDREWGINTWGFGDFYGQRGSALDCALMQRYLASSMAGPEKFEVLVLSTPMGWNRFGLAAREAIVERVRDRGEGLVLLMPFTGERGAPWPEDLRGLSALIDADADWIDDGGNVHQPKDGRIFGDRWVAGAPHPITAGFPFEALPQSEMQAQRYTLAPGAEALITLRRGKEPLLAVRRVGKGRVVTIATRGWSLTPLMMAPEGYASRPPHRYWEAWYSLLARAALWAGGRTLARSGEPQVLAVEGEHADPWYRVRQWRDAAGAVTDWELAFADPDPSFLRLALTAPEVVPPGRPITVSFSAPAAVGDARWSAILGELGDGRWRTLAELAVDPASGRVELPSARVRQPIALVRLQARRDGRLVAEGRAEVVVTPAPVWDDYETLTWYEQGLPFLADLEMARMRDFGLSGNTTSPSAPEEWRRLLRGGMRLHPVGFADGLHTEDLEGRMRTWRERKDRAALVRVPSFGDGAFAAGQWAKAEKIAAGIAPYGPLSYITSDETSLTSYTAEFDLDEHPANLAAFRQALQRRFGDVAALNAAFGLDEASFDAIRPPTGEEAKASGRLALWNAWREHNDEAWAGVFRGYGAAIRAGDPQARLSVSGTQEQAVFNGIDWARLTPAFAAVSGYGGRFQELQRLCFQGPELRATAWCAYGRSGRAVDHQLWSNLLAGGDGTALFWWFSLRNPDLGFCRSGADYQRVIAELRAGIGKQLMASTRVFSPVAVLWSATSQRASWTRGRFPDFKRAEATVMAALYAAGLDPVLLSETQVAEGALAARGVRALVLPMTLALGRGERRGGMALLPALQALLDAGGAVIATDAPELDEFLRPASLPESFAARLTPFATGTLPAVLAKAGVHPHAPLSSATGLTAVLHAVDGPGGARLLTLLREPVGTREVVGADGVAYSERDDSAGPDLLPVRIDLSRLGAATAIDCRTGTRLVADGGAVSVAVRSGDGHPLALLPYAIDGIDATAAIAAGDLAIAWRLRTTAPTIGTHVVRVEVVDAAGRPLRHLCRNVTSGNDGRGTLALPLAAEDGTGLRIRLRDAMTGQRTEIAAGR